MTKATRWFVFGSIGILTVGLCTGLLAYYGGLPAGAAQPATISELAYMPSDATMVAFADVQTVMHSEMRQRLKALVRDREKGQETFREETGIDIENDVDRVVACMIPNQAGDDEHGSGFAAVRGRFDNTRLEGLLRQHGGTVEEYKGIRLVHLVRPHGDDHPGDTDSKRGVLAFAEPGLLLVGDEAGVRHAIDQRASGSTAVSQPALMDLLRQVDSGATAWAVGRADALTKRASLPPGVQAQIPAIEWFTVSGHIDGGVRGTLRAEARDDESAKNLRDVINGALALGRLQATQKPEFQSLLNSLQLSGQGKSVSLSFTLPDELFELLAQRPKRAND